MTSWKLFGTVVAVAVAIAAFSSPLAIGQPISQIGSISVWDRLIEHFPYFFISVLGIALLYSEIRFSRKLRENEFEFNKRKSAAEEKERAEIVRFRQSENVRFSETKSEIARQVASQLGTDSRWAREALEAAKILPYGDTVFGERSEHFKKEKELLAKRFVPYLLERCRAHIVKNGCDVVLLIDFGSTLYPIFGPIGKELVKHAAAIGRDEENWLKRLQLWTNNLPGFEQIMKDARRNPSYRYSDLVIKCNILPGEALPVFAAVAGSDTLAKIDQLRKQNPTARFIALVVGNWIRIRRREPSCPVPMVRNEDHFDVKQHLVHVCDEVFVISPLGKIFVNQSEQAVNEAFGFRSPTPQNPDESPYLELRINDEQAKKVLLVATKRIDSKSLLYSHGATVIGNLGGMVSSELPDKRQFASCDISVAPDLFFPFTAEEPTRRLHEYEAEFPHEHSRKREILRMFVDTNSEPFKEIEKLGIW